MSRVEDISHRLAEIHDALAALDGPSDNRFILLKERDAVRAEARAFSAGADQKRSNEDLESELDSLKSLRKQVVGSRTGYATSKGGNNAGPSSGAWVKLGGQSRAPGGAERLNVRISHIEDVVASRRRRKPE